MDQGERTNGTKLALLIDAGNIRVQYMPVILREASALGTIAIRRIYGDFAGNETNSWHKSVHEFALTPIHVPPRVKGKNAADMKLAIDAMDLLHQKQLDGFCIASSDSDFTTLANRIREDGLAVFGFGEKKATAPYVAACDRFFNCDLLLQEEQDGGAKTKRARPNPPEKEILAAIEDSAGEDGWAHLGHVGQVLLNRQPDFDSRNYGFRKLSDLIESLKPVELRRRSGESGGGIFVRRRGK
jgi:uncharacterized LabA/DUF88 family protein